jgi:integrase
MDSEHVHWGRNAVFNPKGKTIKSRRFVPLSTRLREALRKREGNGSPFVSHLGGPNLAI